MSSILLMLVLNIVSDKRKLVCSQKASKKLFTLQDREGNRGWEKFNDLARIIYNNTEMVQFSAFEFRIVSRTLKKKCGNFTNYF